MSVRRGRAGLAAIAVVILIAGCAAEAPLSIRSGAGRYAPPVALPAPSTGGGTALNDALERRRSARSFAPDRLDLSTIGQLLWAAQGTTSADGKRTAPSAGGRYPLELYVVTPSEVLHYLSAGHRVEVRDAPDLRPKLQAAAFGQAPIRAAPAVVVVAAEPGRTRQKYGARADTYVHLEAGHAAQNLLLEATALDLAAVPIGGLDPHRAATALALPSNQTVLYLIPVGRPTRDRR